MIKVNIARNSCATQKDVVETSQLLVLIWGNMTQTQLEGCTTKQLVYNFQELQSEGKIMKLLQVERD